VNRTEVFLIRHGQTESNKLGLFHGATDVPLNAIGLRQANLVAQRVADIELLRSLHSSPLQRALHTARAISTQTGLPLRLHNGLAEMHFGRAEGLTLVELAEQFPEATARFQDLADQMPRFLAVNREAYSIAASVRRSTILLPGTSESGSWW